RVRAEAEAVAKLRVKAPVRFVPAVEVEPRGVAALRRFAELDTARPKNPKKPKKRGRPPRPSPSPAKRGRAGEGALTVPATVKLLMFGGKGGTGKTTCAAAAALALARGSPKKRILLLST